MDYLKLLKVGGVAVALAIAANACMNKKTESLLRPCQALGRVLAEEAMRAAGANKTIAVISPDSRWGPASTLEAALRSTLRARGYSVMVAKLAYLGDPMKMSGVGLQRGDFYEAVQKAANAGALVSIVGAPLLTPAEATPLPAGHPPILVAAVASLGEEPGSPGNRAILEDLLRAKIIQIAIVDGGSQDGLSTASQTNSVRALFDQNYRILREPD